MSERGRWARATEGVGIVAVIVSLVYVGLQVRQNTLAIQTSASHDVYQLHQDLGYLLLESPEFADLLVRVAEAPDDISQADSLRYDRYLNLRLNLFEAVYTNAVQGTMEPGMVSGWLNSMPFWICSPEARKFWQVGRLSFHPAFQAGMDSAMAATTCPD